MTSSKGKGVTTSKARTQPKQQLHLKDSNRTGRGPRARHFKMLPVLSAIISVEHLKSLA